MDRYKKKSIKCSNYQREVINLRCISKQKILNELRTQQKDLNESKESKTEVTKIPSRIAMLQKWKQEKVVKKEKEKKLETPVFKVGFVAQIGPELRALKEKEIKNQPSVSKANSKNVSSTVRANQNLRLKPKNQIFKPVPETSKTVSEVLKSTSLPKKHTEQLKKSSSEPPKKTSLISKPVPETSKTASKVLKTTSLPKKQTEQLKKSSSEPPKTTSLILKPVPETSKTVSRVLKSTSLPKKQTEQLTKSSEPLKKTSLVTAKPSPKTKPVTFKPMIEITKKSNSAPTLKPITVKDSYTASKTDLENCKNETYLKAAKSFAPKNFQFCPPASLQESFSIFDPFSFSSGIERQSRKTSTPLKEDTHQSFKTDLNNDHKDSCGGLTPKLEQQESYRSKSIRPVLASIAESPETIKVKTPKRSNRLAEKLRKSASCENIFSVEQPSVWDSLDSGMLDGLSPADTSLSITEDLKKTSIKDEPKTEKAHESSARQRKRVSLLYTPPRRRKTIYKLDGDLMSFSPVP